MSDYLWDKQGSDSEIEALENQLSQFRMHHDPQAVTNPSEDLVDIPFWKRPFLFFAVPSFATLLVGLYVFGSLLSNSAPDTENVLVRNHPPAKAERGSPVLVDEVVPEETDAKPAPTQIENRIAAKPEPVNLYLKKPRARLAKKTRVLSKASQNEQKITPEEQHAYDELIRALTITSSKLMLVKDKVDGPAISKKSR